MATYVDDNGNPIAAAPTQKQYVDDNGKPIQMAAALDTSNPQGEGTYKMVGPQGQQVQVPFSKVRGAQDSQFMVDPSDAGRYQKDAKWAAPPNAFQAKADSLFSDVTPQERQNVGPVVGDASEAVLAGVRPYVSAVVHPMQTLDSMGKEISGGGSFDPHTGVMTGGGATPLADMAHGVANDFHTMPVDQAIAKQVGTVAGMYAGGKAMDAAGAAISPGESPPPTPYTPQHAAAFEGAIAPATAMGKNFIPQEITPEALPAIRTTAARMSTGTPEEQAAVQAATSPKTPPLKRITAYQDVVQGALNDLEAQHAPALAKAANVPVDTTPIVQQLDGLISNTTAPADVSAIRELQQRVQNAKTIGDLNTFRQELNTETAPEYKQSQVQAGRSGISSQATSDLAGWVRNAYYDSLQGATGTDFAPLKRQEANLITTKEALQNQAAPLAKAEAIFAANNPYSSLTTPAEKAGLAANVLKDPKTTITQTLLRESPATKVATLLQKSLTDLPEAPQPQPQPAAPTPLQLPAQAGGAYPMPGTVPYSPAMTAGEQSAALNQWLRRRQQMGLPAQASPIPLPPSTTPATPWQQLEDAGHTPIGTVHESHNPSYGSTTYYRDFVSPEGSKFTVRIGDHPAAPTNNAIDISSSSDPAKTVATQLKSMQDAAKSPALMWVEGRGYIKNPNANSPPPLSSLDFRNR